LRNKLEELDGKITHEIIIGKENADLDVLQKKIEDKQSTLSRGKEEIFTSFKAAQLKLKQDFNITGSLGTYKALNAGCYFLDSPYTADGSAESVEVLLTQYNKFKSLPSDPDLPVAVNFDFSVNSETINGELANITNLSTVADTFKTKIVSDEAFFESGLKMLNADQNNCPFCTQEIGALAATAIDAYKAYFEDEEAQHRKRIDGQLKHVQEQQKLIANEREAILKSNARFDSLKAYFSTMSNVQLVDVDDSLDSLGAFLVALNKTLQDKTDQLDRPLNMPNADYLAIATSVKNRCEENNKHFAKLASLASNSGEERRSLQSSACEALTQKFATDNSVEIEALRKLSAEIPKLQMNLTALTNNYGEKASARERVADTFSMLLRRFFQDKYSFDKSNFKVRRNNKEMLRGGDRTLSDGEKSAMAFCYFIAQTHLRVESNDDYKKIYFVFDDPVTSMSFDYVYTIITCLKLLRIGDDGEIEFNLKSNPHKPKMLILTHNNHFYNVASTNNIVKAGALYQLVSGSAEHFLRSQKAFATPHMLQLKDVYDVSEKAVEPNHTTANSIRSVIEGMWKFCCPDKNNFGEFVKFLNDEHEIEIKSVLIQDLCHGGKFSDAPHIEEDILLASKEAILVVKKFAPGQLSGLET